MHLRLGLFVFILFSLFSFLSSAQLSGLDPKDLGEIHGNFDMIGQYYLDDTLIGAPDVPQQFLFNGFLNVNYTKGNFRAGVRYESYQDALLGFSPDYKGNGIPYRYAGYKIGAFDFTAGNFYEQFGNGFALRTYFEPGLGVDNSIDGFRAQYSDHGLTLKALVGTMRNYFTQSQGIIRGADFNIQLNDMVSSLANNPTKIQFGGAITSRYQQDNNPDLILPENVLIVDGRFKISRKAWNFYSEYAFKYNDPSADNRYIYRNGQALEAGIGYSTRGFGINLTAHTVVNMSFRADRNNSSQFIEEFISFVPPLTKPHSYLLMSTLYPYATQLQNEMAFQVDAVYKFPKGSLLGGKYGTTVFANFSWSHNVDTTNLNDEATNRMGYTANLFRLGDISLWHDLNFKIIHKFTKEFELKVTYQNLLYNIDVIQGKPGAPIIHANVGVLEGKYRINRTNTLRMEAQILLTEQDQGSWLAAVAEYTISPHWSFSILDQFNYGNKIEDKRIHYFTTAVAYIKGSSRISVGYGRQREGLFCVGGICRVVPASNGATITLSSTF